MKRTLTLFLNVLFLLALLVPSGIAQECIVHYWLDNSYNTYAYEYSHFTSEGHVYCVFRYQSCANAGCDKTQTLINPNFPIRITPHQYTIFVTDAGHSVDGLHAFRFKCSECSSTTIKLFECNGPPCTITIQRIMNQYATE